MSVPKAVPNRLRVNAESVDLAVSAPQDGIALLEMQLDKAADKKRSSDLAASLPSPNGRARSSSIGKSSAPISIPGNKPVKTTVGFGSGSITRGESTLSASVGSAGSGRGKSPKSPSGVSKPGKQGKDGKNKNPKEGQDFKPKPKLSKAERRAKQEAQRAAKAAIKDAGGDTSKAGMKAAKAAAGPRKAQADDAKRTKERSKQLRKQHVPENDEASNKVELFSHLDQYERSVPVTAHLSFSPGAHGLHPAVIRLGLKYSDRQITGSTARCIAMLRTFKILVEDYITPDGTELSRDLLSRLSPHISFLSQCQPHCDAMGNAIKALKREISEGESTKGQDDEAAKRSLCDWIDRYMQSIEYAQVLIADYAVQKINDGDVILTHGSSQLMAKVIRKACQDGKRFRVVVVDSRPTPNGGHVLRECSRIGIKCTFVLINAVSCVMREVSKVFLTAHALLANGYIMSRVGTSIIAMTAKAYNIPVMVACETYKVSERVQTDSFVHNELGDPDDLLSDRDSSAKLSGWKDIEPLKVLNLVYDVTPPEFVDMVITDVGMIPCTSVPVVLRVKDELHN